MSETKHKLTGCRPSSEVVQEFSNACAEFGACNYRIISLGKESDRLQKRLDELQLEINEARRQESVKVVPKSTQDGGDVA